MENGRGGFDSPQLHKNLDAYALPRAYASPSSQGAEGGKRAAADATGPLNGSPPEDAGRVRQPVTPVPPFQAGRGARVAVGAVVSASLGRRRRRLSGRCSTATRRRRGPPPRSPWACPSGRRASTRG